MVSGNLYTTLTFGNEHLEKPLYIRILYVPFYASNSVVCVILPKKHYTILNHPCYSPPARVLILSPISARFLSVGGSTAVRRCSHCASLGGWGSVIPKIDSYRTASPRATSSYLFSLFQVPGVNVSEDFELFT